MSLRRDVWRVRHELWEISLLSSSQAGLSAHACPTKRLTQLLFRALSALAIFQQSLVSFSRFPSICAVMTFYCPRFVGVEELSSPNIQSKTLSRRPCASSCPPTPLRASFLAIERSPRCTCRHGPHRIAEPSHF